MPHLFYFHFHSGPCYFIINGLLSGQALKTIFVFLVLFSPPHCLSTTFAFEFAPECGPSMSWVQEPLHILAAASWNCRAGTSPAEVKHVGLLWKKIIFVERDDPTSGTASTSRLNISCNWKTATLFGILENSWNNLVRGILQIDFALFQFNFRWMHVLRLSVHVPLFWAFALSGAPWLGFYTFFK